MYVGVCMQEYVCMQGYVCRVCIQEYVCRICMYVGIDVCRVCIWGMYLGVCIQGYVCWGMYVCGIYMYVMFMSYYDNQIKSLSFSRNKILLFLFKQSRRSRNRGQDSSGFPGLIRSLMSETESRPVSTRAANADWCNSIPSNRKAVDISGGVFCDQESERGKLRIVPTNLR